MNSLLAIKHFLKSRWTWVAAGVVILLILLSLAYCTGRSDGKKDEVIDQQSREIKTQGKVNDANEGAADRRVRDSRYTAEQQREIEDAVRNAKGPDDVRAQRGCVILRQQGRDTNSIPACRGFASRP
jgi:hypothetical protein